MLAFSAAGMLAFSAAGVFSFAHSRVCVFSRADGAASRAALSPLTRLCLLRALRPDKLALGVADFVRDEGRR